MGSKIKSGLAMVKVLESWGVGQIYGLPGGSINNVVEALRERQHSLKFIQVRHEETGALAAAAEAKLSSRVGVCFGSAGPGATHLFNGLYDAMMDRAPVLALIGQVPTKRMNYDAFQELNQNPMFADVSLYNRTVMTPQSLPHVVDEAIRRALAGRGVAVVTIPTDLAEVEIEDGEFSTAANFRQSPVRPDEPDLEAAVRLIDASRKPILYVGQGVREAALEVVSLADYFSLPIVASVPAKGIIADDEENYLGTAARLGTKPANEALAETDLIIFIGSDFPFAAQVFSPTARFIQIDADPAKLGKRHPTDVAVLGDAGEAMLALIRMGRRKRRTKFLEASRLNMKNWCAWLKRFENSTDSPLRPEPVFSHINRIAAPDAVFVTDVGNTTIHAVRLLKMNGQEQRFTTSGWFATMGYGLPGGIAAKLRWPERQVFTLSGDGAFSMAMQDISTQVKYDLAIINVVFSNDSLAFIESEQEDAHQPVYGVDLAAVDFAKAAEAMGARGFTVTRADQLPEVFDAAAKSDKPVVIDVKIGDRRPFPSEHMILDETKYGRGAVEAFKARYEVEGMPTLREIYQSMDD